MWSDESKFELQQLKKKDYVWRKRYETYKKPFITLTVKFVINVMGVFVVG